MQFWRQPALHECAKYFNMSFLSRIDVHKSYGTYILLLRHAYMAYACTNNSNKPFNTRWYKVWKNRIRQCFRKNGFRNCGKKTENLKTESWDNLKKRLTLIWHFFSKSFAEKEAQRVRVFFLALQLCKNTDCFSIRTNFSLSLLQKKALNNLYVRKVWGERGGNWSIWIQ